MSTVNNDDPRNSLVLYELGNTLDFLIKLLDTEKFPKVLMMSGKKGIGKFTIINHFLTYVYDKKNYHLNKRTIDSKTIFYSQYLNNLESNIIYLSGSSYKNIKIDDIRELKSTILKSTLSGMKRFIILDDVELFNTNSLNALLKSIEEPSITNYFIIINNKTKPLLDTIYSRSLEIKTILTNDLRIKIINSLIEERKLETLIDFKKFNLSPGNFLLFNNICLNYKISINDSFLSNLDKIFTLYKKTKDITLINMTLFLADFYFYNLQINNKINKDHLYDNKHYVINNINKFVTYNINQNSIVNAINDRLLND